MPALDEDIETEEFMTVEDVFVASYRYSGLKGRTVTLQELSEYPVLMLQRNSATRRNFDMQLNSMGISITPEIELESIELMVEFAKIGLGISHVLKESAIEAINKDELFVIETKEALPLRRLGIASLKGAPLSNASTKFIDLIRRGHTQ
jgi:DNA-binding transcriptional LysR family regulator